MKRNPLRRAQKSILPRKQQKSPKRNNKLRILNKIFMTLLIDLLVIIPVRSVVEIYHEQSPTTHYVSYKV